MPTNMSRGARAAWACPTLTRLPCPPPSTAYPTSPPPTQLKVDV